MSDNNTKNIIEEPNKSGFWKTFLKILLIVILAGIAIFGILILSVIKDAPEIDPTSINASLNQTSVILSPEGELIEKIQAEEVRTVVNLNKMPQHLKDAFVAIEDERFETHIGVDPKGIVAASLDNIKAGRIVRGASTITQQLVKNVYLTREKSWNRKIKEAYLSLKVENVLTKDQILELYLNRIFLGQNAYGVQEAAQAYFSKDVQDLSLAESALIAGIAKSSLNYAPYHTVKPENFNPDTQDDLGHIDIGGEKYVAIFNPTSLERQKLVLNQMLKLEKISKAEYDQAMAEDIRENLKPGEKKIDGISSYFADYVKTQVIETLMEDLDYTEEEAHRELTAGGLKIYSTIDVNMQRKLEETYNNFTEVLFGNTSGAGGPVLISWKLNGARDIIDSSNRTVYFAKNNIFNDNFELKLNPNEFRVEDDQIVLNTNKLKAYTNHIDVGDYYIVDERRNLTTYAVGSITIPEDKFGLNDQKEIFIKKAFLNEHKDFYRLDEAGNMLINNNFFYIPEDGVVQPQSATVVMDHKQGHIKALVGGRNVKGSKMLNRATSSQRQPGSVMKPIATYLPALDNGFTAGSVIDDTPFYSGGKLWPNNWYSSGYKGFMTLREAVEQSSNVTAVKVVNSIGVKTSVKYLEKMGIVKGSNNKSDSFVTAEENPQHNDENLSALGLGGMTHGLTPLEVTAAFAAIANDGTYIKPMSFYKIEDKNGNVLIDDTRKANEVVSPQIAYIMKDILNTTVTNGIAGRAQLPNMATAGKTGTTQNKADVWFVGFTPYYVTGVWIGNDSPAITLSQSSGMAAQFWRHIMLKMHEGLDPITSFTRPDGIVTANVCMDSGLLPSSLCSADQRGSRVRTEIFAQGTVPTKTCETHVQASIDSASGQLATEFCPAANIINAVFIRRNYNPGEHQGIVPLDYQYSVPYGYCSLHDHNSVETDEEEEVEYDEDGNPIIVDPDPNEEDQEGEVTDPDKQDPNSSNPALPPENTDESGPRKRKAS